MEEEVEAVVKRRVEVAVVAGLWKACKSFRQLNELKFQKEQK